MPPWTARLTVSASESTSRFLHRGGVLVVAFVAALVYLMRASSGQEVLRSHEVDEA